MENGVRHHIAKTPGICGGRACIAGHRIRVQDVVALHELRGMPALEIVAEYPGISLADVYAALVYFLDNREEIEQEIRKSDEWAAWAQARCPTRIPAELREGIGG